MKLRARTSVVGTITASLALALAGPALAANASAEASSAVSGAALARFPQFAELTDSKSLSDPLMLQGKLTDLSGKALSGAQVLLAAWPSNEAVSKLPVGGSFDVVPVARTVAGKDGAYQLRSLLTPLLMGLTGKDGLDVEVDVFHGSRHYVYLTQLKSTTGSWVHDFVRGVDGQADELASQATNGLNLALDPATGEKLAKDLGKGARVGTSDRPMPWGIGCTSYKRVDDPKKPIGAWTTLVTAVARNGAAINTKYDKSAKTTTSTGFSFDKGLSFSVNGARERSAKVEAIFRSQVSEPGRVITRAYEGTVQHAVAHRRCTSGSKQGEYRDHYVTSPAGLMGGFRAVEDRSRAPIGCNPDYTQNLGEIESISTENAKGFTYQRAFSFVPVGGGAFTGNALSGYSEQVKVTFAFGARRAAWCGSSGLPLTAGQIVEGYEV